jgi:hypothetical protein
VSRPPLISAAAAAEILSDLDALDIRVRLDGNDLLVEGPEDEVDAQLGSIRRSKSDLVRALRAAGVVPPDPATLKARFADDLDVVEWTWSGSSINRLIRSTGERPGRIGEIWEISPVDLRICPGNSLAIGRPVSYARSRLTGTVG